MSLAEGQQRPSIVPLLAAVLLIPAALGSSQTIFNDGDVSWHIATGQWIIAHRAIPHTDPFSFTWVGKPWVAFEWLSDLIYASAYRLAGYAGVAALVTAALMALHALVFLNAARFVRFGLGALVAMDVVLIPSMLARPHLLVWPLVASWTWLMLRAREQERAPPLAAALLLVLWTNLHGSVIMGLFIAGAFGLEALIASEDRSRALCQWIIFGAVCLVAACINANGMAGVLHPLSVAQLKTLPLIDEWKPSNPAVTPFFFGVLAATLLLIVWKRPRLHPVRWLLLATFLLAAMLQTRHQALLAIVAAMILPEGFSTDTAPKSPPASLAWLAAGAALLVVVRVALPMSPPDNDANPWKLIAAVPPSLRTEPVLNGYSMGGPLILAGIRPYIDGRSDMYGDDFVMGYKRVSDGDPAAFAEAVRRWDIRWAILPNRDAKLTALLGRSGWRPIARDNVGAIYVRPSA